MAVITIASLTGCGDDFSTSLADKLNYRLMNKEIIKYISQLAGIDINSAQKFDEINHDTTYNHLSNFIDLNIFSTKGYKNIDQDLAQHKEYEYSNTPSGELFKNGIDRVMRYLAKTGNIVIMGRGGNFVLRDHPNIIHILLIDSLKRRAANIEQSMKISNKEATRYANEIDQKKMKFSKHHFDGNFYDPSNYNLIINLELFEVEPIVDTLVYYVNSNYEK